MTFYSWYEGTRKLFNLFKGKIKGAHTFRWNKIMLRWFAIGDNTGFPQGWRKSIKITVYWLRLTKSWQMNNEQRQWRQLKTDNWEGCAVVFRWNTKFLSAERKEGLYQINTLNQVNFCKSFLLSAKSATPTKEWIQRKRRGQR